MNPPLLFHLIKKDFRALRGWLFALWIFLPLQWLVDFIPANEAIYAFFMWFAPLITGALIFFAQKKLFQIDPIIGSENFLQTPSVGRTSPLASKLLLWFCAIILPAALIRSLFALGLGLNLGVGNYGLLFIEWFTFYLAVFGILLIPVVLTRNSGVLLLSVFGFLFLVYVLNVVSDTCPVLAMNDYLPASRMFVAQIVAAVVALIVIVYFYKSRRISRTLLFAAIGCGVVLLSAYAWRWGFVQALAEKPLTVKRGERPNTKNIHFSPRGNPTQGTTIGIETSNYQELNLNGSFAGLPPDWMINQTNYVSTAVFPNGEKLDGSLKTLGAWNMKLEQSMSSQQLQKVDGDLAILNLYSRADQSRDYFARIFVSPLGRLPADNDLNVKIAGCADFELWRPKLIHAMPAHKGETFVYRHRRWTILDCRPTGNQLTLTLVSCALDSGLSPNPNVVWNNPPAIRTIWLNQKANEKLSLSGVSSSGAISDVYFRVSHVVLTRENNHPMDAAYIANVKLYIIDYEFGGDFSVPFDVNVHRIGIFDAR